MYAKIEYIKNIRRPNLQKREYDYDMYTLLRMACSWKIHYYVCHQGCVLGRNVFARRSWDVLTSRLGAICLDLGPVGLISGLGPLRLVETFCAGTHRAYCSCG